MLKWERRKWYQRTHLNLTGRRGGVIGAIPTNICPIRHKETICNQCNVKVHLAKVCKPDKQKSRSLCSLKEQRINDDFKATANSERNRYKSDEDDEEVYFIHKINSREPLSVKLKVLTRELNFEIDTGPALSIISAKTYHEYFLNTKYKIRR